MGMELNQIEILETLNFPKNVSKWNFSKDFPEELMLNHSIEDLFTLNKELGVYSFAGEETFIYNYEGKSFIIFKIHPNKKKREKFSIKIYNNHYLCYSDEIIIDEKTVIRYATTLDKKKCLILLLEHKAPQIRIKSFTELNSFQRLAIGKLTFNYPLDFLGLERTRVKKKKLSNVLSKMRKKII